MIIFEVPQKDIWGGSVYAFFLAGDVLWDKGMRLFSRNGIASGYCFECSVPLSGNRSLIGADGGDAKVGVSGVAYIFHIINGIWKGKSELITDNTSSYDYFGRDGSLSGNTATVGSPSYDDMSINSDFVFFQKRIWNMGGGTENHSRSWGGW